MMRGQGDNIGIVIPESAVAYAKPTTAPQAAGERPNQCTVGSSATSVTKVTSQISLNHKPFST